ncbi:TonB-dependent receptor [Sphingomonas populi]|uniref:TonB-dependent receptor n=1 Tax=Sphingomonas populi TaxID=2484750 RepID=A0A4Q6XGU4_9SPHN|nr:TonB-dependent receptor [Sphingomonas populi]RZF59150.1 TonB-dependent receptor [Sphingomonas populi]
MVKMKTFLGCGASAIFLFAPPALAQASNGARQSEQGVEQSDVGVGDIIVTAQRRDQRLQDVPITISAVGAPALANAGVTGITQLQSVSPGLQVSVQTGPLNIYLRGVGVKSGDLLVENSVAVYVDGVYQPAAMANVFEFNGLERIEVLKGPQGTLFGRNATGGVVQAITKDPTSNPEMNFDVGYANYQTVKASAYVSGGLTDTLAANVAIQYSNQKDGWGKNVITGGENYTSNDFNVRGKLKFTPDDLTTITLSGNYFEFGRVGGVQNPPGAVLSTGQGYLGRYNFAENGLTGASGDSYGGSLTATRDFGAFQVRNIAAYQKFTGFQALDQDGGAEAKVQGEFFAKTRMITNEFHVFAPTSSRFQWLAGVYYFNYNSAVEPTNITGSDLNAAYSVILAPVFGPLAATINGVSVFGRDKARSISGFVQGTYPVTDKLNLTAGFRYTNDKVTYTGHQAFVAAGPLDGVVFDPQVTKKYDKSSPTWRLSLDYKFAPDILGYVSWNRGVKSGNFSLGTGAGSNQAFSPERLDAYEVGLKTQFFDRKLTFNTSAFYYDFQNIQFQKVTNGTVFTINGPTAKLYGLEAELVARVTPRLTLNANGGYLHTRIGDFPGAPNVNRLPNGRNDNGDPTYNAKGNRLPFAADFSGNIGFEYRLPVEGGQFKLASNLYYTTKVYSELDNRLFNAGRENLSASLGWEGKNGLRVSVWGANLTDRYYYVQLLGVAGANDIGAPAAPRTYGMTVGYRF